MERPCGEEGKVSFQIVLVKAVVSRASERRGISLGIEGERITNYVHLSSLTTPFNYVPYAPHPHHAHSSVISTLKSCPGEWACYTERVPTRGPEVGEITSSVRPLFPFLSHRVCASPYTD